MNPAPSWMLPQAADIAKSVDWSFEVTLFIALFLAVTVVGLLALFVSTSRPRDRQSGAGDGAGWVVQAFWILAPLVICGYLFTLGLPGYVSNTRQRSESYTVIAAVQPWTADEAKERAEGELPVADWSFTYPNGFVARDLRLPAYQKVHLVVQGSQGAQSLYAPALRIEGKAAFGEKEDFWFETSDPGTYPLFNTVYSGGEYLGMGAELMISDAAEFDTWLQEVSNDLSGLPPVEAGQMVFQRNGCVACHSINGTPLVGPSFQGVWGRSETLADGSTIVVDADYVAESLFNPTAKVVKGFQPVMPPFAGRISDEHVAFLIEYMKSLSGEGAK